MTDLTLNTEPGDVHPAVHPAMPAGSPSEHLANERTHLAYLRTAVCLISLGITVNRFSIYLQQHDKTYERPNDVLAGTASAGLGMVLFALLLMLVALHRFRTVERAIDRGGYEPGGRLVTALTLSVVLAGAFGIVWMFQA